MNNLVIAYNKIVKILKIIKIFRPAAGKIAKMQFPEMQFPNLATGLRPAKMHFPNLAIIFPKMARVLNS